LTAGAGPGAKITGVCTALASDIFWDEKSQKVIFALDQKIYRHRPTEKKIARVSDFKIVIVKRR
jgi:hypothetical protein